MGRPIRMSDDVLEWNYQVINHTSENIGDVNPFRYRGCYFDSETGLYYLNSRYYSPEMGRFISPDDLAILDETKAQINGLNLYMYCGDNPVMMVDENGNLMFSILALVAWTVCSAVVNAGFKIAENISLGKTGSDIFEGVVGASLGAAVNTVLTMTLGPAGIIVGATISSIVQSTSDVIEGVIKGKDQVEITQQFFSDLLCNFTGTLIGNVVGDKLFHINSGQFGPKHLLSALFGKYGARVLCQQFIGNGAAIIFDVATKNIPELLIFFYMYII